MATAGGYKYKFVDGEPPNKYICTICKLVSRDPQQGCCRNVYCKSCLQQLKDIGRDFNCPICDDEVTNNCFPDRIVDAEIKSLQVYCTNNKQTYISRALHTFTNILPGLTQVDNSCSWKGKLKDIDDHLQQCPYQILSCTNGCGKNIEQRQLQHHLENNCPKRLIKCQYCNEEDIYQVITGDHLKVCPRYPIQCTNKGCGQEVLRFEIKPHKRSCPKEIISCEYNSTIGCVKRMKREEQEKHNEQSMNEHLQMAIKEIVDLKSQRIQFNEFSKRKCNNEEWYSPGFYTSPGGYKMSLCVYANGNDDGEDTHVSCYICLMSGEYDDILEWPFQGEVTVELLNQLEDMNHHKSSIEFNESTSQECEERVVGEQYGTGCGCPQFISHSQLGYNSSLNCQYLKDDTLYFRVSVKVTSTTKPWLVGHYDN